MKAGAQVGDFTALDQDGGEVRFSDLLAAGSVVLYFYPKAKTPL